MIFMKLWSKYKTITYNNWVKNIAKKIDKKYGSSVALAEHEWFWMLFIATTEEIARPKFVRFLERIYFYVMRPEYISSGIMQIRDSKLLSDQQSIIKGSDIIKQIVKEMPAHIKSDDEKMLW